MPNHDFHTFRDDMKKEENLLTASMEDYLEMIFRLSKDNGFTRIHELSEALHVHPPSATRMVQRLGMLNLLQYQKYGVIILKENGKKLGELLLKRHNTIESFLRILSISEENVLKETEKIEHTISPETTVCFENYIAFMQENPEVKHLWNQFRRPEKKKEKPPSLTN